MTRKENGIAERGTVPNLKLGISGLAGYVPPYRVWLEKWCEWTGNSWPKTQDVVGRSFRIRGPNQSVYTMAATAVIRLIQQYEIDPERVRFLALGTESSTDNSAGAIIVKGMVDRALVEQGLSPIARSCEVPEFKHACLGGVYAMKGALRYLALDGAGSQAIVVCADIAEYARGSSGEPTQGAGAVAMLLEADPDLAVVDLARSGSASDYRMVDFRKPMLRFCNQPVAAGSAHISDFPIFNGKFSTTCYIDETLRALEDMYSRRGLRGIDYLRSLRNIFMHRPYRRMPETGLAVAYLFALAEGDDGDREELAGYCQEAGIDPAAVINEMRSAPDVAFLAHPERAQHEAYPLTMATLRLFRGTPVYEREIVAKLSLGADTIRDLGNLYTAALPAWFAAGFEDALQSGLDLAGEEILTLGYGSGDAAEVIPFTIANRWREATRRMHFSASMEPAVDVDFEQYGALHDGLPTGKIEMPTRNEFIVDGVGQINERRYQDYGIEFYRYIA